MPLVGLRPTRPTPTHYVVFHGDSITWGYQTTDLGGAEHKRFSYLVCDNAHTADSSKIFGEVNYGINGQGLNYVYPFYPSNLYGTLTADAVTRVDPVLNLAGSHYLVIFAGTNDIFLNSTSGAATWTLLQAYINARISAGWTAANIVVCTMPPRQGAHESDRTALNSAIRSNQGSIGYKIADFAANSTMGAAGAENNATYYADTIHPTDAGHVILASLISAQLFP